MKKYLPAIVIGRLQPLLVVIFYLSSLLFVSCRKNIYGTISLPNQLVVLAEITAGDSAIIPIGSALQAGTGNQINFRKLGNVDASITGPSGISMPLTLNNAPDFMANPMAVYSASLVFANSSAYSLSATAPQFGSAEASTMIPPDFSVEMRGTETDEYGGKEVLRFDFSISDEVSQKNYYVFEAVKQLATVSKYFFWQGTKYDFNSQQGADLYQQVKNNPGVSLLTDTLLTHQYLQLDVFTQDMNTANTVIGPLDSAYKRIFITDSLFNGKLYTTHFFVARDHFHASSAQQTGIVLIRVKSVARELYEYLLQYEKYSKNLGNLPVGNLTSPQGNVKNGIGIFGGAVRKQWSLYYDSL